MDRSGSGEEAGARHHKHAESGGSGEVRSTCNSNPQKRHGSTPVTFPPAPKIPRWVFDVESEKQSQPSADGAAAAGAAESKHGGSAAGRVDTGFKDEKEIQKEIACILRYAVCRLLYVGARG